MNYKIFLLTLLVLFTLSACTTQTISEVKTQDNVGKEVRVEGRVQETIKLGEISGYRILGEDGESINVESNSLPAEGEDVTVSGTLEKRPIVGWVIVANT